MKKCWVLLVLLSVVGVFPPMTPGWSPGTLMAQPMQGPGGGGDPMPNPMPPRTDPPVITSETGNARPVAGSTVELAITAVSETPIRYQWFFNGTPIPGATNPTFLIENITPTQVGTYFARAENEGGVATSRFMHIGLVPLQLDGLGNIWTSIFDLMRVGLFRANDQAIDGSGNTYVVGEGINREGSADYLIVKYDRNGNLLWSRLLDVSQGQADSAKVVQIRADGLIVVTGTANVFGIAGGNPATDRPQIVTVAYGADGDRQWIHRFTANNVRASEVVDMVVQGNTALITGNALGSNNRDILSFQLNAQGQQGPHALFDGGGRDEAAAIAADPSGNFAVVGTSRGQSSGDDIITIFYNQRVTELWNRRVEGDGNKDDVGTDVLIDRRGRIITIGGRYRNGSGLDFSVTRFSPAGNEQISVTETSRGNVDDVPTGGVIDSTNAILIAGVAQRNNPGPELIYAKISEQGQIIWASIQQADGRPGYRVTDVAPTPNDGMVIAGTVFQPASGSNGFVLRINRDGLPSTRAALGRTQGERLFSIFTSVGVDPFGDIIASGQWNRQASDTGAEESGETQILVSKFQVLPPARNTPPNVVITEPDNGQQFEIGDIVNIRASAIDAEGPVRVVEFLVGNEVVGRDTEAPFEATWEVDQLFPELITARVTDSGGIVVTAPEPVLIVVSDVAPAIVSFPSSQVVTPGATVTLVAEVTGREPLRMGWFKNGERLRDAEGRFINSPTLVIENFGPRNSGRYEFAVDNRFGRARSPAINLELDVPNFVAGDNFADRATLGGESGQVRVSTEGATREPGEPRHAGKRSENSVWFSYAAPANGLVTISTLGANFDTTLAVYTGTELSNLVEVASDEDLGGFLTSSLRFRAQSDQEYIIVVDGFNRQTGTALLTWSLDRARVIDVPRIGITPRETVARRGGTTVFSIAFQGPRPAGVTLQWYFNGEAIEGETGNELRIENVRPRNIGQYRVDATLGDLTIMSTNARLFLAARRAVDALVVPEVRIENKFADLFNSITGANDLALQPRRGLFPRFSVATGFSGAQVFNTFGAVKELSEPDHCGVPGGASQWFGYKPPRDGTVAMSTDGSDFDTVLAVYTTPDTDFTNLMEVACDNDSGVDGVDSAVTFDVEQDIIYFIAVDGVGAATGLVNLTYQMELPLSLTVTSSGGIAIDGGTTVSEFTFTVDAEPNIPFTIEMSADAVTWTTVTTGEADESRIVQFQDADFNLGTVERYFRVLYQ